MFDITFVGHMCYDEIVGPGGHRTVAPGSAVLCGALAAARVGKKVAVITRMSTVDAHMLDPLRQAGITTHVIPSDTTTYMRLVYPDADVDNREMVQLHSAGFFTKTEMPDVKTRFLHLAGITDQEFTPEFVHDLYSAGFEVSLDIQSFVRRVDPTTRRIDLMTIPEMRDIFSYCTRMKLDIVEAKLLSGAMDIWGAARILAEWGGRELVITEAKGVLSQSEGGAHYVGFTNQNVTGRTGRGDTTFAGYLAWRQGHGIPESLRFAAAMASIKMESPGPFTGSVQDVLARMGHTNADDRQVIE